MYKVMLVDDDYPVLELITNAIAWQELGLDLYGVHENGAVALEHGKRETPDILITDIGMPKMNGLDLIRHLNAYNKNMRVAILSCHSEFHYAQQALKLNVQDYLVKDTFSPEDLYRLLQQFVLSLDKTREMDMHHIQLQQLANKNKSSLKRNFIRNIIHQPIPQNDTLLEEARSFDFELDFQHHDCLPIVGFVDNYQSTMSRFISEDIFQFAIDNVVDEVVKEGDYPGIHFTYGKKQSVILFMFKPTLKVNMFDVVKICIGKIQTVLQTTLKVSMSFLIGNVVGNPEQLKEKVSQLINAKNQRFYLKEEEVAMLDESVYSKDDIFRFFNQALVDFRNVIMQQKTSDLQPVIMKWLNLIEQHRFPQEEVKDWTLKLLLDLKLKLQSLQHFPSSDTAHNLHKLIGDVDSLPQLKAWMAHYFQESLLMVSHMLGQSGKAEVSEAVRYVAEHLGERITLDNISRHLHMNSSYFSRMFRKETGETFIEYVTRKKIERAVELLDQTNLPVSQICELLAYDNQSYFIKTFKTIIGQTPSEYRGRTV